MAKISYLLSLLFIVGAVNAQNDVLKVREDFHSMEGEAALRSIIDLALTNEDQETSNIIMAYQGASKIMMAEHVFSPFSKFKYFKEGKKMLEESIALHQSVENIYLRLLIQLNLPRFLNYNDDVNNDISFLVNHFDGFNCSIEWKKKMVENLLTSKFDNLEIALLKEKIYE